MCRRDRQKANVFANLVRCIVRLVFNMSFKDGLDSDADRAMDFGFGQLLPLGCDISQRLSAIAPSRQYNVDCAAVCVPAMHSCIQGLQQEISG